MLVYMVDHGKYLLPEESLKRRPEGKRGLYVNITNECPCACTFCLRTMKDMPEDMSLWLGGKDQRHFLYHGNGFLHGKGLAPRRSRLSHGRLGVHGNSFSTGSRELSREVLARA